MAKTRNFADVIRAKLSRDQDLADSVEQERFNADIASQIFDARKESGLTQKQLADRIGTHQSVIARLEDADYDSHSLTMLKRIGQALGKRVGVTFYSPGVNNSLENCEFILDNTIELVDPWSLNQEWSATVETTRTAEAK